MDDGKLRPMQPDSAPYKPVPEPVINPLGASDQSAAADADGSFELPGGCKVPGAAGWFDFDR